MKRLALATAAATVGLLPACFGPTEPILGSELLLTGTFIRTAYASTTDVNYLSMRAGGGQLAGEWREYRSAALTRTATVTGTYDTAGRVTVHLRYSSGGAASWVANPFGADFIAGLWTDSTSGIIQNLIFYRTLPPPCADTLSVLGKYIPPLAPAYFVGFRQGVDPLAQSSHLAARYGISVIGVHTSAPTGFSAELDAAQLMVLQCEPSVDSIAFTNALLPGIAASGTRAGPVRPSP